jgi:arginase
MEFRVFSQLRIPVPRQALPERCGLIDEEQPQPLTVNPSHAFLARNNLVCDAQLIGRLKEVGCFVADDGDVTIPSYLPHHSIPPIRSWPAPRIAWECVSERVAPLLQQPGQIPLLIGCDCSVVIGTTQALMRDSSQDVHVLYVDGDFDDSPPNPVQCQSAASCAVWLLTHVSPFWAGPPLRRSQVSVIGWSNPSRSGESVIGSTSLGEIRRLA